jgi:hypothetical protein
LVRGIGHFGRSLAAVDDGRSQEISSLLGFVDVHIFEASDAATLLGSLTT